MANDDQSAVIAFLSSPAAHAGESVRRVETHSAIVFLSGKRAWKLKRSVRYDYLDFSTAERRRIACEREVRLNTRTAPSIYRGVAPVVRRADGSLAIGGPGTAVDWLVDMNRFDDNQLFDRLAARQALGVTLMHPLAVAIAEFHRGAEPRRDHGGRAGMTWVATGNADGFARFGEALLNQGTCQQLTADTLREIERHAALLEIRRAGGLVRQCHGDLHLRNIVLLDGRPTLFDAIEFNDEIGCTDVLYDLAFLLMDLWRRQLPRHANAVWNGYLAETGDHSGISLMPLFLSCRAAVRAKTSVTAARLQSDATASGELVRAAQDYLTKALQFLRRPPASIVAIGGFSGTGKSTLARALAAAVGPPPGAIVLRSDELRKRLCGVSTFERLEPEHYSAESSHRVYAALTAQAAAIVRSGYSAIVDAVFARPDDRTALERAAAAAGVPFFGSWLQAPESILVKRLRSRALDASDADAGVLHIQEAQSAGQISWQRLGASAGADAVLARAASHLAVATSAT